MRPGYLFRCSLLACILALVAGCSGGGGGNSAAVILSGQVLAPNGQIARNDTPSMYRRFLYLLLPAARAEIAGLAPVADGTTVDLVRINDNGAQAGIIASTTTSGGTYRFNLSELGISLSSDLIIRAGGYGGSQLRAFASRTTVDIGPASEAAVRLFLTQIGLTAGANLSMLTLTELNDLTDSVNLIATLHAVAGSSNIENTVTELLTLVNLDPGIVAFIQAAVATGQTTLGTGDIGNLFPLEQGNIWNRLIEDSTITTPYIAGEEISGTKLVGGVLGTVLQFHNYDNSATTLEEYDAETSSGITYLGNNDPTDFLSNDLAPFHTINYPIAPGINQNLLTLNGLTYPEDLDQDGKNETYDASVTATPVGTETVTVQAGTFPLSLRLDTDIDATLHLSNLRIDIHITEKLSQWLSPGVGVVKQSLGFTYDQLSGTSVDKLTDTSTEQLLGYRVNGIGKGVLPKFTIADTLANANSDSTHPGRAAIATDGTHYLVVTCRDTGLGSPDGLIGVLISAHQTIDSTFTIASHTCQSPAQPAVAFNGTNYLVAYSRDGAIYGILVSPGGTPDSEFMISPDSISNFAASAASDGSNFLVTWQRYETDNYEIRGTIVSATGMPGGLLNIFSAAGEQVYPAVTFNGSDYFVAWRDTRDGSGPSLSTDIYGTRVGSDGSIKDPGGIAITTASGFQGEPQVTSDGTNALVVWIDTDTLGFSPLQNASLHGKLVDGSGNLVGNTAMDRGITINASSYGKDTYTAAFDGTRYLIAWTVGSFNNALPAGIYATHLSADGTQLDTLTSEVGMIMSGTPDTATAKYVLPALSGNGTDALLVWLTNEEISGGFKSLAGAYIYP